MKNFFSIIVMIMILTITPAVADESQNPTTVTVDLTKLDQSAVRSILETKKKEKSPSLSNIDASNVKEWSNLGKNIGEAIGSAAKSLSIGVNDFMDTKAGTLTVFLILWHFVGHTLFTFVGGIGMWLMFTAILYKATTKLIFPQIIRVETFDNEQNLVKTEERIVYGVEDENHRGVVMFFISVMFCAMTFVCMLVIF